MVKKVIFLGICWTIFADNAWRVSYFLFSYGDLRSSQTGITARTVFRTKINALIETDRTKSILRFLTQPKAILLFAAVVNYLWFFSMSWVVDSFFTNKIKLCLFCPWYWDWSLINPPSLILYSAICLFIFGPIGKVFACIISAYAVIQGIIFLSGGTGLIDNISEHIRIILAYDHINFYDSLVLQYLFAFAAFIIAVSYLSIEIIRRRR